MNSNSVEFVHSGVSTAILNSGKVVQERSRNGIQDGAEIDFSHAAGRIKSPFRIAGRLRHRPIQNRFPNKRNPPRGGIRLRKQCRGKRLRNEFHLLALHMEIREPSHFIAFEAQRAGTLLRGSRLDPSRFSQVFQGHSLKDFLLRPSRPVTPSHAGGDGSGASETPVLCGL